MRLWIFFFWWMALPAMAHDPGGQWTSSSGARIDLWSNMEQVTVTVTGTDGKAHRYAGRWMRFSDAFQYQVGQTVYQAVFEGPNQLVVTAPGQPTRIWTRGRQVQEQRLNPAGLYTSSSGSSVQIGAQGNGLQITVVDAQGRRIQGSGRWLTSNRFEYTMPGHPGKAIATINLQDPREIQVQTSGGTSRWFRQ